jgi:putative two-component system response regulator
MRSGGRPVRAAAVADILVVDDTQAILQLLAAMLRGRGHGVRPVADGALALEAARAAPPDLILLDINMPSLDGYEVCAALKADPRLADIPVIFISADTEVLDKVKAFALGAVDYVTKPFRFEEIAARVETHLEIRHLRRELEELNASLQERVQAQVKEISDSQLATILALAKLAERRDDATGNHILRVQRYSQVLAERLHQEATFADAIDDTFVETIFHASALHDIGKVGISDSILLKPGTLTDDELTIMRTHSALGADTLGAVLDTYPGNGLVRMGREISQCHHERWDGTGYPDGLAGEAIPLAARILAIADQYDALRNRRPYKPAFDAARTYAIITEGDGRTEPGHHDPRVLDAFRRSVSDFEQIQQELRE